LTSRVGEGGEDGEGVNWECESRDDVLSSIASLLMHPRVYPIYALMAAMRATMAARIARGANESADAALLSFTGPTNDSTMEVTASLETGAATDSAAKLDEGQTTFPKYFPDGKHAPESPVLVESGTG